ncbi:sugar transferase [Paludibaculum fermentans]|uniref:sugar transferase n=1 Tax=Paludibaculum fermentans TaxID=1473598 RepID=UPI003EB96C9B
MTAYPELGVPLDAANGRGATRVLVRLTDAAERIFAAVLLLFASPLCLAVAIIILVLSRRSPFVAHLRRGQFGHEFWMWKFRTMWPRQQTSTRVRLVERVRSAPLDERKGIPDPRISSRFARLCRKFSVDELPQLWHVLSGRMALIGPRPLTPVELDVHYGKDMAEVLTLKPGITGLWQVCGRNSLTYRQRRRLDLFFVRHNSSGLRWLIVRRSLAVVLSGRNAS